MPAHLIVLFAAFAGYAAAQESRASIAGRVTDAQEAAVPAAAVAITNSLTNFTVRVKTNDSGFYEASFLNPGAYTVAVEAAGFKRALRSGINLSVGDRLDIPVRLEVGALTESVTVGAQSPLLETATASSGRVIDQRQIIELPFNNLNPFTLAALAAGVQWTGRPEIRRLFDNAGTSSFNTAGGIGQNEYTMDGAPVTGTRQRVGFTPPSDAVEEFKMETTAFDASYGHTSGAVVNVMTKAGTNQYHGSLYNQHWQQRWNATNHFTRLAYEDRERRGLLKPGEQKQASGRSNTPGFSVGGPVAVPRIYNGRDKLFFFFNYNGIYSNQTDGGSAQNRTVPKMAWRAGDFSDLLAIDATRFTVYDPASARLQNGRVVRTPFPGNRGVPVLNPMYSFYEKLYPQPNDVPGVVSAEGLNNFLAEKAVNQERFWSVVNRIDYNIGNRHRLFGRWMGNRRKASGNDYFEEVDNGLGLGGSTRNNKGAGVNWVWTVGARTTMDVGVNFALFDQSTEWENQKQIKPTDVGLPAYLDAKAGDRHILPNVRFSTIDSWGQAYPTVNERGTNGEAKVNFATFAGRHSLRYGFSERRYWFRSDIAGYTSGSFTFNQTYLRAADNTNTASNTGLEWAAFRLGVPATVVADTNDSGYWSTRYRALYLQDDVRLTRRLQVNLGLRYEREGGSTERFDRGIAGGFLFDTRLPFTDQARAAYARSPLPELPASQFQVLGGVQYLGAAAPTITAGTHNWLPRAGMALQLNDKTVLRAGYGWYYDTLNVTNVQADQTGFSQQTSVPVSTDNGLTFCCNVGAAANLAPGRTVTNDPFPARAGGTRFDAPYRDALGVAAMAGRAYSFLARDYAPARQQRWRIGVQRQLSASMVVEASFNATMARIPVDAPANPLPQEYWSTGAARNSDVDNNLLANVPNPFLISNLAALQASNPVLYGYLGGQSFFTASTIRKNQLLRPFPHMSGLSGVRPGVSFDDSRGSMWYRDLQVQFERRFARGFQSAVAYTWTASEVSDFFMNEFEARPSWRVNDNVRPHRLAWSAIWELPFGKGRRLARGGAVGALAGGWQLSWIYQIQSGPLLSWGKRFYYGDLADIAGRLDHDGAIARDVHQWFDGSAAYRGTGPLPADFVGFEGRAAAQPGQFQVRTFPSRFNDLRADGLRFWDVKIQRRFDLAERLRAKFSVDLLNATNHTNYNGPNLDPTSTNFGRVTSQNGAGRVIQLNFRLEF